MGSSSISVFLWSIRPLIDQDLFAHSLPDGHDAPRLTLELAAGVAAMSDDVLVDFAMRFESQFRAGDRSNVMADREPCH